MSVAEIGVSADKKATSLAEATRELLSGDKGGERSAHDNETVNARNRNK
jgi:hypothetical protein